MFAVVWFGVSQTLGRCVCALLARCGSSERVGPIGMCYTSALLHAVLNATASSTLLLAYASQPLVVSCANDGTSHCDLTVLCLQCFTGFLLSDAVYVVACYPACGGVERAPCRIRPPLRRRDAQRGLPAVGNVLLSHEWSTVFLNLRWFVVSFKTKRVEALRRRVDVAFFSVTSSRVATLAPFVVLMTFVLFLAPS